MPGRDGGVVEIVGGIAPHAEALHDSSRALVADSRQSNDLGETDRGETELESRPGTLSGIAVAPLLKREPVSELDARQERRLERWHRQTDEADEVSAADHFDGP